MNPLSKTSIIILIALFLVAPGCNQKSPARQEAPEESTDLEEPAKIEDEMPAIEMDKRGFGEIIRVEDTGYPFRVVTIKFPQREETVDFNINVEAADIDVESLGSIIGQFAEIQYKSELENNLQDVWVNGSSVLGEYAAEHNDASFEEITGKLGGAAEPTPGDLPGLVTVASSDTALSFEYFVPEDLVPFNGQEVRAFYNQRSVENITYLRPAQKAAKNEGHSK